MRSLHLAVAPLVLLILVSCMGESEPPNVLLITLDTTRADHLSSYGYEKLTTPRLDQLARDGVLFENAISQASVTPVSHASILTGLNPPRHGLRVMHGDYENRLRPKIVTLAETLQAQGYETAAFVSAFPVSERFGMNQGYATFDADFVVQAVSQIVGKRGVVNTGRNQRRGDVTTDRALAWLTEVKEPFHLWLHYFDCHDALLVPPKEELAALGPWPKEERARLKKLYDAEIEYTDRQMGRVIDALAESHRLENTIIVVVSDHGEGLGDHDWWTHGVLYQEQVHVPLVIRAPSLPAGAKVSDLVRTVDIMPTILELAGIEEASTMEGQSLVAVARGEGTLDPSREAYSDSVNLLTYGATPGFRDVKDDMLFCVVRGDWKYIHHFLRPVESELFNLASDPKELFNLLNEHPDLVKEMKELAIGRGQIPEKQLNHHGMAEEDIQKLTALGYVSGGE